MKRILFLSSFLLQIVRLPAQTPIFNFVDNVQVPWEQQMTTVFQNVNLSAVTTHVLLDRGLQLCPVDQFSSGTTDTTKACTFSLWQQLYGTLFSSAWQSQYRLPDPQSAYLNISNSVVESSPIPFAILAYDYHLIDPEAFNDGLLSVQNDQLYDVPNRPRNPYLMGTCFAATPMLGTIQSLQSQFVFQQNLYFSNNGLAINQVQVDFSDGLGYRTAQ